MLARTASDTEPFVKRVFAGLKVAGHDAERDPQFFYRLAVRIGMNKLPDAVSFKNPSLGIV